MSKFASACQRKAKSAKPKPPDAAKKERKPWKQEPHTQEQKLQNRTPSKNENRGDESFRNGWKCLEIDQVGAINNLRSFIFGALLQPKIATTWEVVRPVFCSFLITFLRPLWNYLSCLLEPWYIICLVGSMANPVVGSTFPWSSLFGVCCFNCLLLRSACHSV